MAHGRRAVPLGLCPVRGRVEDFHGVSVFLSFCLFLPVEQADSEQSYLVGWINIAGWLTLITTEAFFAGVCSHPQSVIRTDRV